MHTAESPKIKKNSYCIFIQQRKLKKKKIVLACILTLITSLLKSRDLDQYFKKPKKLFYFLLISGIMNLYVKCTPDINKVVFFYRHQNGQALPHKIRTSLLRRAFLEPQTDQQLKKHDKTVDFYQTIKQCSLPQVGRIWGANTFPLRNQSPYPISETSQGSQ